MQAKFIDFGTRLDISFINDDVVSDIMYSGSFYNTMGDFIVLIEGKEFYDYCSTAFPGFSMKVNFFAKSMHHTFKADYIDTVIINNMKLVRVSLKTTVDEISRREFPRMALSIMAKVYVTTDTKMEYGFDALTADISLKAVSLYSTLKIPPDETPENYAVGVTLRRNSFVLPCKLIRVAPSYEHEKFFNKYVFGIDYSADKDLKERLLFAFFEYKKYSY